MNRKIILSFMVIIAVTIVSVGYNTSYAGFGEGFAEGFSKGQERKRQREQLRQQQEYLDQQQQYIDQQESYQQYQNQIELQSNLCRCAAADLQVTVSPEIRYSRESAQGKSDPSYIGAMCPSQSLVVFSGSAGCFLLGKVRTSVHFRSQRPPPQQLYPHS